MPSDGETGCSKAVTAPLSDTRISLSFWAGCSDDLEIGATRFLRFHGRASSAGANTHPKGWKRVVSMSDRSCGLPPACRRSHPIGLPTRPAEAASTGTRGRRLDARYRLDVQALSGFLSLLYDVRRSAVELGWLPRFGVVSHTGTVRCAQMGRVRIEETHMHDQELDALMARMKEDQERFYRQLARRQRIGFWFMIPYGIGGVLAGVGIGFTFDYNGRVAAMLITGFTLLVFCQWSQPYWTRRSNRNDSVSETSADEAASVEESASDSETASP